MCQHTSNKLFLSRKICDLCWAPSLQHWERSFQYCFRVSFPRSCVSCYRECGKDNVAPQFVLGICYKHINHFGLRSASGMEEEEPTSTITLLTTAATTQGISICKFWNAPKLPSQGRRRLYYYYYYYEATFNFWRKGKFASSRLQHRFTSLFLSPHQPPHATLLQYHFTFRHFTNALLWLQLRSVVSIIYIHFVYCFFFLDTVRVIVSRKLIM